MGNIFSSEEKLLRQRGNEMIIGQNSRRAAKLYEQYKYHPANDLFLRQTEHRYKKRRNVSFNGRYNRNEYYKSKSHSLNAILDELYLLEPKQNFLEKDSRVNFESGSLIPRIKLRRSTSSLKEERKYNALYRMSSESEIFESSTNSSSNITLKKDNNGIRTNVSENNITILLNDEIYDEIPSKTEDNYFTKNFDDCMKRLQLIEKEHELIEKSNTDEEFSSLQKEKEEDSQMDNQEIRQTDEICNYKTVCEYRNIDDGSSENNTYESEIKLTHDPNNSISEDIQNAETKTNDESENESQTPKSPTSWYSNLKNQFERKEQENQEQKTKEMSCRITGATLKNQNEKCKSEENDKNTRHYFSRLVKTNKSLIDEELPDPDKVKNIRTMFQEQLNSTLKRKLDKKLGGSLQNISCRATEQHMSRPLSAQCYRNDMYSESQNQKWYEDNDKRMIIKEISRPLREVNENFQIDNTKKKLFEKYEKDLKSGREFKNRKILQPKWTDTGSVSSGISSDLSSYDTDLESYLREGMEQEEMAISDDDLLEEVKDKHYVQNEVLEKIRSFGTSVTYYGGEMITCSVGPLLSPTTQAIIEEIGGKNGDDTSQARSFDEFYRKYVEINEPNRKKKLGRTRSFGQNDVFQKPNVLNNTEIEMYKNDLEIEIGIKKPVGIPQGGLRKKVTKSTSLNSGTEPTKTQNEKTQEPQVLTSENVVPNEEEKQTFEEVENKGNDPIIKNEIMETSTDEKPITETKSTTEIENHIEKTTENNEEENETIKEKSQIQAFQKDRLFFRSESAPGELLTAKNPTNECKAVENSIERPAKEIYFSYEKKIFNGKRKPDMEFEEFEVCETLTEKLEKLEKINSSDKITEDQEFPNENQKEELQVSSENHTKEEENKSNFTSTNTTTEELPKENENQEILIQTQPPTIIKNCNNSNEKKETQFNHSKWPIETTVMVDIQKSDEQTPKIITSGKTVAKTKIRLF